jgi:predicted acyl esterase
VRRGTCPTELEAVKHGYAYIEMNERGRYFSEGDYDILGVPADRLRRRA